MNERVTVSPLYPMTPEIEGLTEAASEHALGTLTCCESTAVIVPCAGLYCQFGDPNDEGIPHGRVIHATIAHAEGCKAMVHAEAIIAAREGLN